MNINAIIIEDEFRVRQVLVKLLQRHCPGIQLMAEAENITTAYDLIIKHKPDVIFLDIEMAGGNGFDLLAKFQEIDFEIIFVTSYGHYAIKAIKYSALDYLLKPVMVEELKSAVERAIDKIKSKQSFQQYALLKENLENKNPKKLGVLNKGKLQHILVNEILYMEGDGNYSNIYLESGEKYTVAKTLKEYEEILCAPDSLFFRVHKSYIVNIKHAQKGEGNYLLLQGGVQIEVSRRKKQELMSHITSDI